MEDLRKVLESLGLSPIWASVVLILIFVLTYFVKKYVDFKSELEKVEANYNSSYRGKIDDQVLKYVPLQVKSLLEAYRLLYEEQTYNFNDLASFTTAIRSADDMIMKPFTEFTPFLTQPVKDKIYTIHNVLEQLKHNPSHNVAQSFLDFRNQYFELTSDTIKTINELI